MKGCIINYDKTSLIEVFDCINDFDKCNCLITNIECCPADREISEIMDAEYCWIDGKELLRLLKKEDFQWIWGVFSVFPKYVTLDEVLKYDYPYADGYTGFWKSPISVQHPLAVSEIVAWDGMYILLIAENDESVNTFMKKNIFAEDLEEYNRELIYYHAEGRPHMSRGKIIVVEDERDIREGLCELLTRDGYDVTACGSVQEAERSIAGGGADLYLLDVMLPDGSGFGLCEHIRDELGSDVPVIFLTALDDEDSVVRGLETGGNDYLGKPFRKRELMARVGAHLNRYHKSSEIYRAGDLSYDKPAGRVYKCGEELELRKNELKLLGFFMENPGILIPRERLLELMWDIDGEFVDDNTLSVEVSRLRKKLGRWNDREYIDTVRGIGYRWN